MAQYGITEDEVERCLREYHTRRPTLTGNPKLIADIDGRRIMVVLEADSDPPKIITVGD